MSSPRTLYLHANAEDYLADSLLHGLGSCSGSDVVDVPRRDALYDDLSAERRSTSTGAASRSYGRLPSPARTARVALRGRRQASSASSCSPTSTATGARGCGSAADAAPPAREGRPRSPRSTAATGSAHVPVRHSVVAPGPALAAAARRRARGVLQARVHADDGLAALLRPAAAAGRGAAPAACRAAHRLLDPRGSPGDRPGSQVQAPRHPRRRPRGPSAPGGEQPALRVRVRGRLLRGPARVALRHHHQEGRLGTLRHYESRPVAPCPASGIATPSRRAARRTGSTTATPSLWERSELLARLDAMGDGEYAALREGALRWATRTPRVPGRGSSLPPSRRAAAP